MYARPRDLVTLIIGTFLPVGTSERLKILTLSDIILDIRRN